MNDFNVLTTPTFSGFVAEVEKGQAVRLCLGEKYDPEKYGAGDNVISVPAKRIILDVQGFNREGDLVWLSRSVTVRSSSDGPASPGDEDRYDGMSELRRITLDALEGMGYRVRPGQYTLPNDYVPLNGCFDLSIRYATQPFIFWPNDYVPLNGCFDCAKWYEDEAGRIRVRPVEMPPVASTAEKHVSRFRVSLQDTNPGDAPPVPVEVRVDRNSVLVRIPAAPDAVYSAAEVYLEHYGGQIVVRAWDQKTMRKDYGGDPVSTVTLLADSADRTLETEAR
ncbi:MAG: hypothetical protein JXC32_19720 [Anaerolineae bacterium]|nr:hypothetical protein [Anaerolineae bacterium]